MKCLPAYEPPLVQRACVAAALAPVVVLLVFTALVARLIDVETAMAWFGGSTVWVVHEMWDYQRHEDAYSAAYEARHLAGRSGDALRALLDVPGTTPATRSFVLQVLARRLTRHQKA